jgi:hypothetical protein
MYLNVNTYLFVCGEFIHTSIHIQVYVSWRSNLALATGENADFFTVYQSTACSHFKTFFFAANSRPK